MRSLLKKVFLCKSSVTLLKHIETYIFIKNNIYQIIHNLTKYIYQPRKKAKKNYLT